MLVGIAALVLPLTAAVVIFYRKINILIGEVEALKKRSTNQLDDISGLCSAALTVEQRLSGDERRLAELYDWMESQKTGDKLNQPYHSAISLIRRGADVAQLMAECSISHEEASLLLRLHGSTAKTST